MEVKKETNKSLLEKLTTQNDRFKDELEMLGSQMNKLKKPQQNQTFSKQSNSKNIK